MLQLNLTTLTNSIFWRCCMAWFQTSWAHRLAISQFLCATRSFCINKGWRWGAYTSMCRRKTGMVISSFVPRVHWLILCIQRLTSIQKFFDGQVCCLHVKLSSQLTMLHYIADTAWVHFLSWPYHSIYARVDRDPVTKRLFWFTISESSRGVRNEIPEKYRKEFANKSITCGKQYLIRCSSVAQSLI